MISLSFLSEVTAICFSIKEPYIIVYYYFSLCQSSFKIFIFYGIRISYYAHRRSDFFWGGGLVNHFFTSIFFCDLWVHFLGYYASFLTCGLHIISAESCSEIKC